MGTEVHASPLAKLSLSLYIIFGMEKNKVAIVCKNGPLENIKRAILSLPIGGLKGASVLIKPNIGRAARPGQGINTHPLAVAGAIEALQEAGVSILAVGESPIVGVDTMEAFRKAGITEITAEYKVPLLDLNEGKPVKTEIPGSRILGFTKICQQVFDFDFILSLPVAKCHMHTGVTLGIKNMKGCLWRHEKVRYHQLEYQEGNEYPEKALDTAISDLATILRPHLSAIDGYIGMEGLGPSGGEAVKSDFAVASWNPVGADIYACLMMGIDPAEIPHIRLTAERTGYSFDPATYQVCGANAENYTSHIISYTRPPSSISIKYPNIVVHDCDSCSACQSTVMLFLRRFKDDMSQYLLDDGKFHIGIGKGLDGTIKQGTVLIGNCTKNVRDSGLFIPGCPPVPTRIYKAITGNEPEENEPEVK
ncbi:MAG: DUF362 domain-containing protein [Spirochaetales bacterium]|nr:DUF362 domain-containing protein [Spirochaetales bacterium]